MSETTDVKTVQQFGIQFPGGGIEWAQVDEQNYTGSIGYANDRFYIDPRYGRTDMKRMDALRARYATTVRESRAVPANATIDEYPVLVSRDIITITMPHQLVTAPVLSGA